MFFFIEATCQEFQIILAIRSVERGKPIYPIAALFLLRFALIYSYDFTTNVCLQQQHQQHRIGDQRPSYSGIRTFPCIADVKVGAK